MAVTSQERYISFIVVAAVALLLLDWIALTPYLQWRSDLSNQARLRTGTLEDAHRTLEKEAKLRQLLARMSGAIKSDQSTAEGQLLHLVQDWQQQAGVSNPSFQRVRITEQPGLSQLTFHVSGVGPMSALAMFLYRIETAPVPLRVDDIQLSPRHDNSADLQIHLTLSTLCHRDSSNLPQRAAAPAIADAGALE